MISIVDDDESVREATKGLVRSLGYGAATFASAEEFLQSNAINETECVISDVQMPGLSGVELQSQLIAQGNPTPIIFVTASPEERTRARALKAGAIGVLSKLFNEERLIEYLYTALAVRKMDPADPPDLSFHGKLRRNAPPADSFTTAPFLDFLSRN
jgi:FixJ family two-component response regulator